MALNPRARQEWAPLAIGATLGFPVMVFGPLTGGSFNPARWFGPALIGEEFGGVWPLVDDRSAPIVGALARGRWSTASVIAGPQYAEGAEPPTSDVRGRRQAVRATRERSASAASRPRRARGRSAERR